ncbi:MAG: ThiF family adenylyltransferase [Pseudonocardia sp.]|nr:ThiF family adenylyltransferase [Pseudonocardia sp.]
MLPTRIVLAPHLPLLSNGGHGRRIGLDPARSLAVDDLPEALAVLLDGLVAPVATAAWLAGAAARGVPPEDAGAFLQDLLDAGALVGADQPERVARHRAAATVVVRGDGPLAAGVAGTLARSGVGTVHVVAAGVVLSGDVGCGYTDRDAGRLRSEALVDVVHRVAPDTRSGPPPRGLRPDLVVLADMVVPDPLVVTRLLANRTDHLPVLVRDGLGLVGPLALIGRTPCARCVELARAERDDAWPGLAAQLAGRCGSADPATLAATAASGAAQALAALDGPADGVPAPPTIGATLELDGRAATVVRRRWQAHPDCPCGAGATGTTWPVRLGQGTITG